MFVATRSFLIAAGALVSGASLAQTAPRTPWGDPDLSGTYTSDNWIGVPFQRPERFGTREQLTEGEYAEKVAANDAQIAKDLAPEPESKFEEDEASNNAPRHWLERPESPARATSIVVDPPDGRVPAMTAAGERLLAARRGARRRPPESYADFSNYDRCISRGVTGSVLPVIYGNGTQIIQAPGVVAIRNEMIHEARVIPLDGQQHAGPGVHMWMGDSRGHFEGNTLVIETTNFTDRTGIGGNGNGAAHSDALRLIERIERLDGDTLRYEFTVIDPETYTAPWTARFELDQKQNYEIYEYACHEGNLGLANMLSAARAEERAAKQ